MPSVPQTVELGLRIVNSSEEKGVPVRLLGGVAVYILASAVYPKVPSLSRIPKDIDLVAHAKDSSRLTSLMENMGIEADKRFNALHGYERLMFREPSSGTRIDVFLDVFRESHVINLKDRLEVFKPTIPPSDLLLTKLQIWSISERDIKDIIALLLKFKVGSSDSVSELDANRLISLTSNDWGLYKTVIVNLSRVTDYVKGHGELAEISGEVIGKINDIRFKVEKAPKSIKWRLRSLIGERVKWYEEPEEVS
ncbi:nucleotidyltransferase family protein [Caldivirga sp.]|uniref:nucleotidyltransferase family protein n=1 Tax=Caldivirga sp. TaxID=2080243 RepID=UPI003D0AACD2